MNRENLVKLARLWLSCFETKDLSTLVGLYAERARHVSPKLRVQRPETGGCIEGQAALRDWWGDAFTRLPELRYVETRITAMPVEGQSANGRVVLEYDRLVPGEPILPVAEVFEIHEGKIVESRVYHG